MWPFSKKTTYTLTPTQELLLALLRAQLWLQPVDDIVLPGCNGRVELSEVISSGMHSQSEGCENSSMAGNKNDTDEDVLQQWNELMDLAYKQTVVCFISAACLRHKDADKIPQEIHEEMEAVLEENKKIHEYHNKTIVEVFTLLEDNGLHPILLKGQGLAHLYDCVCDSYMDPKYPSSEIEHCTLNIVHSQNSVLRQCGDIDIFIGPNDYEKACRIMDEYCGTEAKNNACFDGLHYHISDGSMTFELHYKAADAAKTYRDKEFNAWAYEWLVPEKCDSVNISGKKILVPNPQYNTLYVFDHLIKHVRCEGVNLRQFCDWMMIISRNHDIVNSDILLHDLKKYSAFKAWKILGGILVNQLGQSKETFPYWNQHKSLKSQNYLLSEIINGGCFRASSKLNDTHTNQKRGIKRTIKAICLDYQVSRFIAVISYRSSFNYFTKMTLNRVLSNIKVLVFYFSK